MPLRIVAASEPIKVETIILTLYGTPGAGKSSLGFSADKSLTLDTDAGAYRSAFRKDLVQVPDWGSIAGITAADVKPYRTIVLDTAGRALDHLSADIIAGNPKMGRGGALTLQGYGELKTRFTAYLNLLRSFGLDVVLIAHSDEKQQGDEMIERIDMQGGSKNEVYKSSDSMARLGMANGKRVLSFSPTETRFGKDPAGIGNIEVPNLNAEPDFLATVIARIKASLNEQSATAQEAVRKAGEWRGRCEKAESSTDFDKLVAEAGDDRKAKRVLLDIATERGFTFDADSKQFVPPLALV